MTGTPAAILLAALIYKLTDFVKHCTNRDTNAIVTQLSAWAIGCGVVVLFAHSSLSAHLVIDGISVANAPWADLVLLGFVVGSFGSAGYDLKRALDGSDSAATPPMVPGPAAASPAAGPELPPQPDADPELIDAEDPPPDAPEPPGGYGRSQPAIDAMGVTMPGPPASLGTAAGRSAVRTARTRKVP